MNFPKLALLATLSLLLLAGLGYWWVWSETPTEPHDEQIAGATDEPVSHSQASLPNLHQLCSDVYSGGQPDAEAGFRQLAEMGVKTIISVDGARPEVELAKSFGLDYVHLPHGYDGIEPEHAMRLAKAVATLTGPIYIHCHHGKHRSPAAAAVACVSLDRITAEQGIEFLRLAGTSQNYQGLYRSVANSSPVSDNKLQEVAADFPAVAPGTPLVQSMVAIEKHFGALSRLVKNDGLALDESPDLDVAHEALLLFEQFTELLREDHDFGAEYGAYLAQSKERAESLQRQVSSWKANEPFPGIAAQRILNAIKQDCRACHQKFRD